MAILKRLHTVFRACVPLVLSLLALVLAHRLVTATTRPVELVVDDEPPVPLPRDCTGVNPPDTPCCLYGYVYYDDVPVAGASVRVESPYGTLTLTTAYGGLRDDPYYSVDLSSSPINATVGTLITVTVTYSDASVSRTWTVISEGQQVDAGLYSHSATEAIVFTCGSGADPATDDTELYMVEPDGSNLTRLTHNGYVDWNPRLSPDGTRIAFCLNETGSWCVLSTMDVDGGDVVTITDQAGGGPYAWVPDGTGITFGLGQVYTIELATGNVYTLTSIAEEYRHPDWSPDGTKLAVDWVQNDSGLGLVVLDLISGTQTMIRSGRTRIPDWHPDGDRIAYELLTGQLRTINPDGTGDTPISTASVAFSPRWSPDGTQIAYVTLWNGQVRIINADRTGDHAVPNVLDLSCGWVEGLDWGIVRRDLTLPAAAFTAAPLTGTVPLEVTFTDQSTGDVNFWTWDFGDGHVSGGRHPANEYQITGTHTVTLAVTGPGGSDAEAKADYITVSPVISPTWAFLLYLDGDNDLHSRLQSAFDRLEAASANPHVAIVILLDGPGYGDTWQYKIRSGVVEYKELVDELDMGDPLTLSDFIIWARQAYTTEHTYLAVTDHGRGTSGIAWDDTAGDDEFITVAELRTALQDATVDGTEPLDVVHYDACLMAMIENGYQIKDYADYFVASQNLGWSIFAYDRYVAQAAADTTPEALAAAVVSEYYNATTGHPRTISALDLDQAEAVEDAVSALATALQANLDAYKYYVSSTRSATQKFDSQDYYVINNDDEYLDLYDLARLLKQNVPDQGVKDAAQGVMDAVVAFVIAEQHESGYYQSYPYWDLGDAHGVSIYFPPAPGGWDYDDYMSHVFRFTVDSEWDEFLEAYFGLMGLPPTPPADPGRPPVLDKRYSVYLPVVMRAAPPLPNTATPAGIPTPPHVSTRGVAPGAVNQFLTIEPLYKYGGLRGCTSVYTITNQGGGTAFTQHSFYDGSDYIVHAFDDPITAGASKAYDLAGLVALPDGYVGYALVGSDWPITYALDACPRQAWGTNELDPGASVAQTFNEEGVYPVTDPTTIDPTDPAKRVSGEVRVGMGITPLSLSASSVTTVTVTEDGFTPQVVQVAVGDTVRWVNEGSQTHGVIGLERVWHLFLPLVVRNH